MGCIYRPVYRPVIGKAENGKKLYGETRRSKVWWLKYRDHTGRTIRESSDTDNDAEARRVLRVKEGRAAEGHPVIPRADKVTMADLAEGLRNDYRAEGYRLDRLKFSLKHLLPFFGHRKALAVRPDDVTAYEAHRLQEGAATATVNRELAALKRMFTLAVRAGRVPHAPYIKLRREDNARQGFFEREQFEAVRRHLPEPLRPALTFAYLTGWRIPSEVLPLTWAQVDLKAGVVRLEPGTTKNREGRTVYLTPELRTVLEAQEAATRALQRTTGRIIPSVFHRAGEPIRDFRRAWRTATARAGVPGRIPHDLRRTAVRNLVRAGIPERVAMLMTGHKTRAVFDRYDIVSPADLQDAARKLTQAQAT